MVLPLSQTGAGTASYSMCWRSGVGGKQQPLWREALGVGCLTVLGLRGSQGTRLRNLPLTRLSPLGCGEVKNARERALVPDVFDLAAGQVDRSEAEIALTSSVNVAYTRATVHPADGL